MTVSGIKPSLQGCCVQDTHRWGVGRPSGRPPGWRFGCQGSSAAGAAKLLHCCPPRPATRLIGSPMFTSGRASRFWSCGWAIGILDCLCGSPDLRAMRTPKRSGDGGNHVSGFTFRHCWHSGRRGRLVNSSGHCRAEHTQKIQSSETQTLPGRKLTCSQLTARSKGNPCCCMAVRKTSLATIASLGISSCLVSCLAAACGS